ncbi:hypothetical protein ACE193_23585 [Bernardetia sp. OM2101]|uniref:hypothetical protein n=1 Tax=Bernardetia sp. OM2101 TaxID=3344876 RepID=UPI0035CFAFBC
MKANKNPHYYQSKNLRQRIISLYEQAIQESTNPRQQEIYQRWISWLKEKEILSQAQHYNNSYEN